jgi:hypothetical protein
MPLFKILKILFCLWAAAILCIACCVTPLYFRFIGRLNIYFLRPHLKRIAVLLCIFCISLKIDAQTDSAYADTPYYDTVAASGAESAEEGYNDQDDGYVDTTVQHIYDTSQFFFTWKKYYDDPYPDKHITQQHLSDNDIKELKNEDDFWYVPAIEKLEARLRNDPKFRDSLLNAKNRELAEEGQAPQTWYVTLRWIIIIFVFVAALFYFLAQNKISLFSRDAASATENTGGEEREDIFRLSYSKLIQKAEKEKEYRMAVRLMFLETLKMLSETNNIQYQPDHTDLKYLQQLHGSKYYNDFFNVMRSYEYVWYGKFDISTEKYNTIKNNFLGLRNRIT